MKIEQVIGRNVLRIREECGLSQADLGRAMETRLGRPWSRQAVSAAEKGRRSFTAADLVALSCVLDSTLPALFLPSERRVDAGIELGGDVHVTTEEYRDRILRHGSAEADTPSLTRAGIRELATTVVRLKRELDAAQAAVSDLAADVSFAAETVGSAQDSHAPHSADRPEGGAAGCPDI